MLCHDLKILQNIDRPVYLHNAMSHGQCTFRQGSSRGIRIITYLELVFEHYTNFYVFRANTAIFRANTGIFTKFRKLLI
jgi:hypothetical protein